MSSSKECRMTCTFLSTYGKDFYWPSCWMIWISDVFVRKGLSEPRSRVYKSIAACRVMWGQCTRVIFVGEYSFNGITERYDSVIIWERRLLAIFWYITPCYISLNWWHSRVWPNRGTLWPVVVRNMCLHWILLVIETLKQNQKISIGIFYQFFHSNSFFSLCKWEIMALWLVLGSYFSSQGPSKYPGWFLKWTGGSYGRYIKMDKSKKPHLSSEPPWFTKYWPNVDCYTPFSL